MKKLAIFDLDGTLLNTIADLAHSTNYALNKLGYPTHEIEKYNFMVGNGINKLFEFLVYCLSYIDYLLDAKVEIKNGLDVYKMKQLCQDVGTTVDYACSE